MPKLFHVADTHLGYQAYNRLTPEGLNQREVDFQSAFERFVDAAVAERPDIVVHAGDLFDHPRPTNRAIAFALQQVRRLSDAKIPTVIVSGNHDAPRLRETGSIFRVFEGLPHVHPVYAAPARIDIGDATIHAVPQAITQEAFHANIRAAQPVEGRTNVLLMHGTVLGVDGLFSSEFNEYQIPSSAIRADFDYIALGHFHLQRRIAPNAWYSGSTECCSFAEADQTKGWLEVAVGGGALEVRPRSTSPRMMRDLGRIDASQLAPNVVADRIRSSLAKAEAGAIIRLGVENLDRSTRRVLDWPRLRQERRDAVHVEFKLEEAGDDAAVEGAWRLGTLGEEFEAYLARRPLPGEDRELVRRRALELLASRTEGSGAA